MTMYEYAVFIPYALHPPAHYIGNVIADNHEQAEDIAREVHPEFAAWHNSFHAICIRKIPEE
jgi:hypothetical protein